MMLKRPQSISSIPINVVGLICFLLAIIFLPYFKIEWSLALKVVFILLATALPIIILEVFFKTPPLLTNISPGFNMRNWRRVVVKLIALYSIFCFIAFVYWVFPEYHGDFYQPFWNILLPALPWLVFLAIPYFFIVDGGMEEPNDSYYFLGLWLLREKEFERALIIQLLLGWLVKLFFLPLMIVYFTNNLTALFAMHNGFSFVMQRFENIYNYLWLLFFTIDLVFACIGYVFTMRLLDTYIRSTEPTTLGWVSTLICYQPFYGGVSAMFFAYNIDNYEWGAWLADSPVLYVIWGSAILILLAIYSFSSVMFGVRFSNLTNRGIITNGPYRFVKHPAFVSKNISWWLIAVPFISQSNDMYEIVRSCFMLLCLNGIYYIRAKTEERHLMSDPSYREYSSWIEKEGVIAKLRGVLLINRR